MQDADQQVSITGRTSPRVEFESKVTIRFEADSIVGSGENVSDQGVFFVVDGVVPVTVEIEGRDGPLIGELVRVETMAQGQVGIAVKFDERHDDLIDG